MILILFHGALTLISEETNSQILLENGNIYVRNPEKQYLLIGSPDTYNMETTPRQVLELIQNSIMNDEYNIQIEREGKKYVIKK